MHPMSRQLIDLGEDTLGQLARGVAAGAGVLHLQLIASQLYEAVKRELDALPAGDAGLKEVLSSALEQCRRAAKPGAAPPLILVELGTAVAMLSMHELGSTVAMLGMREASEPAPARGRPQLRVIQGGRA
jgi:hypothetical protein